MRLISSDVAPFPEQDRRHIGMYEIGLGALHALFCMGSLHHYRVKEGIPLEAELIGAEWSNIKRSLLLYFEHPDFPAVYETVDIWGVGSIKLDHIVGDLHGND